MKDEDFVFKIEPSQHERPGNEVTFSKLWNPTKMGPHVSIDAHLHRCSFCDERVRVCFRANASDLAICRACVGLASEALR